MNLWQCLFGAIEKHLDLAFGNWKETGFKVDYSLVDKFPYQLPRGKYSFDSRFMQKSSRS